MVRSIIGAAIIATLGAPAWANDFWVEYDYTTHECSIVEATPEQSKAAAAQRDAIGRVMESAVASTADATSKQNVNDANAAGGANGAGPPSNSSTPNNSSAPDNSSTSDGGQTSAGPADSFPQPGAPNDPIAALWARKEAAAKAAHIDVTRSVIGSPMETREDAEAEMQVMRKCGLRN